MKTRGFTLIELIAIISVLALIMLVAFPALVNTRKADEQKRYDDMVKNLCEAGKSYITANMDSFDSLLVAENIITIHIDELILYGNVKSDLKNPSTGNSVSGDDLIFTVQYDRSLVCEYDDK